MFPWVGCVYQLPLTAGGCLPIIVRHKTSRQPPADPKINMAGVGLQYLAVRGGWPLGDESSNGN